MKPLSKKNPLINFFGKGWYNDSSDFAKSWFLSCIIFEVVLIQKWMKKKKSTYQFFLRGSLPWFFGFCKKLISLMYYFSSSSHSKMNVKKKSTYQFFFPGLPRLALVFSKKLISSMYFFWGGSHTKMNEKKKSTYHFFFFTPASENLGSGLKLIFSFISTNILFFYIFPYKHHEIQKSGFEWKKQGKKITRKSKCFHCIYYQNHL